MKITGAVSFRDIETGVWVLVGDDGRTYELAGGDRRIKRDGQRIEVDGEVDARAVTAGMIGPLLRVTSYRVL